MSLSITRWYSFKIHLAKFQQEHNGDRVILVYVYVLRVTGLVAFPCIVEVKTQFDWDESVSGIAEVDVLDRWRVRSTTDCTADVRTHRVHDAVDS